MPVTKVDFVADLDLRFFPESQFEKVIKDDPDEYSKIARNVLRLLMMGWNASWRNFITRNVLHAVFVARNAVFLKEMRWQFQCGFLEIYKQLKDQQLNLQQMEQVQLYLSNCMSLLPYSDLTPYESIKIPQYLNDKWELVEYKVTPIELTEHFGNGKHFIQDYDRVFAYGLSAIINEAAQPHLIFMGTTYPAGQGFLPQVMTDSKGFETVGQTLYETGRARIHKWLEYQEKPIHVCGTSLGGSLSLLLAMDKNDKYRLSRVDALNPAGINDTHFENQFNHWDELKEKPIVVVQKGGNDVVSQFGKWLPDWIIRKVSPPKELQGPNGFVDHALNYAGLKGTKFIMIDAELDNKERKARDLWIYSLGRGFLYYTFLVPYYYVMRPAGIFISQYWKETALLLVVGLAIALIILDSVIGFTIALGVAGTLLYSITVSDILSCKEADNLASMHDPKLPRNKEMDIYDPENIVDIEVIYSQVNTYYKVMRCVLQKKSFLPEASDERSSAKRKLLEDSELIENADKSIYLSVTKAKAWHMMSTLSLWKQKKPENETHLIDDLGERFQEYKLGKK